MSFWGYLRGESLPSSHYVEVVEARIRPALASLISGIRFDEEYYLRCNPDVLEKVRSKEIPSGRQHYIMAGYFEDRYPRPIPVDEPWYLKEYPDVAEAVSRGAFVSAKQHFEQEGYREGRLPSPNWTLFDEGSR